MNKPGILYASLFVFLTSFSSGQDKSRVEKDLLGEKSDSGCSVLRDSDRASVVSVARSGGMG